MQQERTREDQMKRYFSLLLVLALLIGFLPAGAIKAEAAATLTLAQLREKFPHGKYWNHVDNPGSANNNQDGYSSTPCPQHGNIGTSTQTCNGFAPNGRQLSWQCMGYAEKLGYDATGYNPRNNEGGWYTYTSVSALDNLKPGDIVRYDTHSIYVTAVNGETVTFTDCNYTARCYIRWDATISMTKLRSSFQYVRSAPFSMASEPVDCGCSEEYAGTYKCTTVTSYLNIRAGHGTSYSIVSSIPPGGIVTVTEASGTSNSDWAHVEYNGITGYASMQYLEKQPEPEESALFDIPGVSMSLGNDLAMYFYVKKTDAAQGCYMQITKTYADGRADAVKTVSMDSWVSSGEYYLVPFDGISAKEMTDTLYAVVYDASDTAVSSRYETSIERYALDMLRDETSPDKLKAVLANMLNYGAAAQAEFTYNTSALANAGMTQEEAAHATAAFDISTLNAKEAHGTAGMSVTMSLKSSIVLNVFLDPAIVTTDMTAKISYTNHNGKAVSYEIPGSQFRTLGSYLYLNVDTLAAGDIETVASIGIYDGNTLISESQYNMACYCVDNAGQDIVAALAKFCTSAYDYFHT